MSVISISILKGKVEASVTKVYFDGSGKQVRRGEDLIINRSPAKEPTGTYL
jgi:hypothetical protein